MRPDKGLTKRSFSEASQTYDRSAVFQREVAGALCELLPVLAEKGEYAFAAAAPAMPKDAPLKLLDIGCGTGYLMTKAAEIIPAISVYGCDIALPMLKKAAEKQRSKKLTASDCEMLPFADESFDILASSLAYQWSDISNSFYEAARVLKTGGLFLFTTLGAGTFKELRACYTGKTALEFHDARFLSSALTRAGFAEVSVESRTVRRRYESLRTLLRTLKEIGAAPSTPCGEGLSGAALLRKAEREYALSFPSPDGGIYATYEVIFASARKING